MRWYADNSELYGIWGADIPDILVFGGVVIPHEIESVFHKNIQIIKSGYHLDISFPLKWNLKDVKKWFEDKSLISLYNELLTESKIWRKKLFEMANKTQMTAIVAVLLGHSTRRQKQKQTKKMLVQGVFANGLQRFGLHIKENSVKSAEIILDWPEGNKYQPFNDEYKSAYNCGKTTYGQDYYCGKLSELNFFETPLYAAMNECAVLQFSDLLVGATKEFVETALGKNEDSFGSEMLGLVINQFRGYPNNILGQGIIVSPRDSILSNKIDDGIKKLLHA